MIAYFPTVYEDELLYSVIARYHEHSGNIAAKHTIEELFGNQKYVASFEFPTQLKLMHDKLSIFNVLSLHEWIEKHTLYAYYTNFLNEESKEKIYQGMIERRKVEVLQNTAGINTTTIKPRPYFKFCPECVKEDMLDLGETYWRMSHQLPSMFLCLKHSTLLRDSTVLVREINRHSFFSANPLNCLENDTVPVPAYSHKTMQLLLAIAKQSLILSNKNWNSNPDEVHAAYRYLLYSNGYKSVSGNTDLKKLTEDFQQFYGEEFLRLMQSSIDINDSSCWLHKIARKHSDRSFHPIRHLLFIHFLGETVEGVLDRNALSFEPFGSGPFPCLNVACNYYKQLIIPNVIITRDYDTGAPIGTFTCSCGFTYARKGPDSKCEDRYRIGKIKTFGSVWLEKLREYIVVDKKSLTETSKLLHSNRHTVSKYFSRITAESENFSSKISNNTVEDNYKKEWLELCKKYPHLSKTELRKKAAPFIHGYIDMTRIGFRGTHHLYENMSY